jgi:multidrug efflux system membrane fusion protein
MRAAGTRKPNRLAAAASLVIVTIGVGAAVYAVVEHTRYPSTDDASIDADVVHVASPVGGKIIAIPVVENARVAQGDLLFQIDPAPYRFAADQAQADLDFARASLATQQRFINTQRSTALVAGDQVARATANLDLATRTVERLTPLAAQGYVPKQQLDQAETAQRDAATSVLQAKEQAVAAKRAIDTDAGGRATMEAREASLRIARRALDDTAVRASHGGRVVGLTVTTGEIIAPNQSLFTLIDADEWYAMGNFREYEISRIAVGDCATVYSMVDRSKPIHGRVQGIGSGVLDSDRINLPRSVPYVERSLNWVRVAQRFPVRVRLESPPPDLMRLGATSTIEVKHGAACR